MNRDLFEFVFAIGLLVFMLFLGFASGTLVERRHYRSIRAREERLRNILLFPIRSLPEHLRGHRSEFVCGSVVIGMDYFKMTLAKLRNLVGGRVGSFETLFDRARREAILRMKEEAKALNAECVLNVKFSTANLMSGDRGNKGSGCVEVIVYGTALIPK